MRDTAVIADQKNYKKKRDKCIYMNADWQLDKYSLICYRIHLKTAEGANLK